MVTVNRINRLLRLAEGELEKMPREISHIFNSANHVLYIELELREVTFSYFSVPDNLSHKLVDYDAHCTQI